MKLIVIAGAKKGAVVPLKRDRFVIGRSKECSLRAASDAISRKHCELRRVDDGSFFANDLGSRNGTYVNGERIEGERKLTDGDLLRVGPLEFRCDDPTTRAAAPPADSPAASIDDDISSWLLGAEGDSAAAPSVGETLSMRSDETRQIAEQLAAEAKAVAEGETTEMAAIDPEAESAKGEEAEAGKPGKLPFRPPTAPQPKDSREAAEQILREMARRR